MSGMSGHLRITLGQISVMSGMSGHLRITLGANVGYVGSVLRLCYFFYFLAWITNKPSHPNMLLILDQSLLYIPSAADPKTLK